MNISDETLCILVLKHGPDMTNIVRILRAYLPELLRDPNKISHRSTEVRMQINSRLGDKNIKYYLRYSFSAKDFVLVATQWGDIWAEPEILFNLNDICEP